MRLTGMTTIVAMLGLVLPAAADPPEGEAFAGRAFARHLCAECHYVEPDWVDLSQSYAPPFMDIADNKQFSDIAIRVFLRTPHVEMPNFVLTQAEIDNVVAYFGYLRGLSKQ